MPGEPEGREFRTFLEKPYKIAALSCLYVKIYFCVRTGQPVSGREMEKMYLGNTAMNITRVKSLIQIITGWILTGFFGLGIILYASDPELRKDLPFVIGIVVVSMIPLVLGYRNKHKIALAKRYNIIFEADQDGIFTLEQLARQAGKPQSQVEKETTMLIEKGFLKDCTFKRDTIPTIVLSGKKQKTKESVFRRITCPNCGAEVILKEGQRTACSYCGTYFSY